eukprot:8999154-Pyramimonas_sp.AAC.1
MKKKKTVVWQGAMTSRPSGALCSRRRRRMCEAVVRETDEGKGRGVRVEYTQSISTRRGMKKRTRRMRYTCLIWNRPWGLNVSREEDQQRRAQRPRSWPA